MLFRRQNQHLTLCVLQVSTDVLDLEGVIVTDANAASPYRRSPLLLVDWLLEYQLTFANGGQIQILFGTIDVSLLNVRRYLFLMSSLLIS